MKRQFLTLHKFINMKIYLLLAALCISVFYSCGSGNNNIKDNSNKEISLGDTIRIANDSLEYAVIIIEPGFESWLVSQPPRNYHSQSYLQTKNRLWVSEYNNRVNQSQKFSRNLYTDRIDYDPNTNYGYEVNYLLYNYFVYFQEKYKQNFIGSRN